MARKKGKGLGELPGVTYDPRIPVKRWVDPKQTFKKLPAVNTRVGSVYNNSKVDDCGFISSQSNSQGPACVFNGTMPYQVGTQWQVFELTLSAPFMDGTIFFGVSDIFGEMSTNTILNIRNVSGMTLSDSFGNATVPMSQLQTNGGDLHLWEGFPYYPPLDAIGGVGSGYLCIITSTTIYFEWQLIQSNDNYAPPAGSTYTGNVYPFAIYLAFGGPLGDDSTYEEGFIQSNPC